MCIVYDNIECSIEAALLRTAEMNESTNREREVVISIAHQVMAIHIRNYLLSILLRQPYEGGRTTTRERRTTKHFKLINYMPIT